MSSATAVGGLVKRRGATPGLEPGMASVTDDLMRRAHVPPADRPGASHLLTVVYARAHHQDDHDPRHFVLRPDAGWRLSPGGRLGFGRAPEGVDVAVPLMEGAGHVDQAVPRQAGNVEFLYGAWHVVNRSRSGAALLVSAPGLSLELTNNSAPFPIRGRRLMVTVPAHAEDGDPIEHRFTLMVPGPPGRAPEVVGADSRGASTVSRLTPPGWTWAQQRLLAAWAYPELIGLPARGIRRGSTCRQLLRQPPGGKDYNEKPLTTLRRKASLATGTPMVGEVSTPAFLSYVVARRRFLGQALTALHREYDDLAAPTS